MSKNNNSHLLIKSVAFGMLAGYLIAAVLMSIAALVMTASDIGDGGAKAMSLAALALSSFVCGFVSTKLLGSKAFVSGLTAGMVYYLSLAVISAIVTGGGFTKMFFIKLVIALTMSITAAILATFKKNEKNWI